MRHSGGSALEHFYFAKRTGYWLGSLTPEMFAFVVLFFCAIAAPISWKKAQFQDSLIWCGWEINFSHDTIQLVSASASACPAHLGHQRCTASEILASAAILCSRTE